MSTTISALKCSRCKYQWFPRKPELPKVCPVCKSRQWAAPVKRVVVLK